MAVICCQLSVPGCYEMTDVLPESDTEGPPVSGTVFENDADMKDEWECYRPVETGGDPNSDALEAPGLVCVFDIDDTLTCRNSAEAVAACRNLGASLAVNTAESHDWALNNKAGTGDIDWAALGFPTNGAALDMSFGAFMFGRCSTDCSCSEAFGGAPGDCDWCSDCGPDCPASYMGKAYGMHRIASHFNVEPNKCLVLFDDLTVNTDVAQTFCYSAYNQGNCESGWDNDGVYLAVYSYLTSDRFAECWHR
jgi:hypothetical protein